MTDQEILRDKKIPLVAKLLNLAGSENEHEAKLALEQASDLMERFNISKAEAIASGSTEETWVIEKTRVYNVPFHLVDLYFEIAEFCDGKGTSHHGLKDEITGKHLGKTRNRRDFSFYGTADDFQSFTEIVKFAKRFIETMLRNEKQRDPYADTCYRNSYRVGVCNGMILVLKKITREREARYKKQPESTALVIIGKKDALDELYPKNLKGHKGSSVSDGIALGRGIAHGKTFSPESRVKQGSTKLIK